MPQSCKKLLVIALAVVALAGCKFKGDTTTNGSEPGTVKTTQPGYWLIRPVTIRVYPTSSIKKVDERWLLDLRIEALDELGDPTKVVGTLRLALNSGGRESEVGVGQQMDQWAEPLLSMDDNKRLYDPITRTYHLKRALTGSVTAGQPVVVRITLEPTSGPRIEAGETLVVGQ